MAQRVNRECFITPTTDRAKMVNWVHDRALDGDKVVLHDHRQGEPCEGRCLLFVRSVTETPWDPNG